MIKVLNAVLAIVAGVGGALLLYWLLNKFAERLPGNWEDRVKPWVFVGPAVVVIGLFLIYPALRTLVLSFANADSTAWVGFSNYADLLSSRDFIFVTLLNTLLWIAVVPVAVVVIGLFVAVVVLNVALCALMATIYLATLGKQGLQRVGELSTAKAHYAAEQLTRIPGVSLRFAQPFFKEFTLRLPRPAAEVRDVLIDLGVLAGVPLPDADGHALAVAVTEKRSKDEIDVYAAALAEVVR